MEFVLYVHYSLTGVLLAIEFVKDDVTVTTEEGQANNLIINRYCRILKENPRHRFYQPLKKYDNSMKNRAPFQ